jgi:ribosomal protein S18 acetylase RimI-like enzyme
MKIRDYQPPHDAAALRACIVEMQDFERAREPDLPAGETMADAYLDFIAARAARMNGRLLVAELDGAIVGFVGILPAVPPEEPDEPQAPHAYVSDLVVRSAHRREGIGRKLLDAAEAYAREAGATVLRINVLANNTGAAELYDRAGFAQRLLQLSKRLD